MEDSMDLESLGKSELIAYIKTLECKNQGLEQVNSNNKTWLALLAHDFRGLFGNLIWMGNLYKSGDLNLDMLSEIFPELTEVANKNLKALDDTFSRVKFEQQNIVVDQEQIDVLGVFQEVKEFFLDEIKRKKLELSLEGTKGFFIFSNRLMLKSILIKILHNAIKFSYPEQQILVKVEKMNQRHQIIIQDFGTGIPDVAIGKLFTLDISPSPGTADELGPGLGLVLVNEALILLNGSIKIHSEVESGTQVYITI